MIVTGTERLMLRHLCAGDLRAMCAVFGDPDVMRYGDGCRDEAWVRRWLDDWPDRYRDWGFGMWAVAARDGGQVLGYCGLSRYPRRCGPGEAELGVRLARAFWGQGVASEAAGAVCSLALRLVAVERVVAIVDPHNAAAVRVVEKLGFRPDGEISFPGYSHPDRRYALETGS